MNNFWILVWFELKKILIKKSVVAVVLLALLTILFSSVAMIINSSLQSDFGVDGLNSYDSMLLDKSYAKELTGIPLDGELILEASKAYKKVNLDLNGNILKYTDLVEYQKYARKYSSVYAFIDGAYAKNGSGFNIEDFQNITPEMANNYYTYRENEYRTNLKNNSLFSNSDIEKIMSLDENVQKPFTMYYTNGYNRFFALSIITMMIALFVLNFSLAPIFCNEYTSKTDALILTSINGKSNLIYAKILSSLIITFSVILGFSLIVYFCSMAIYGFDGANAQIQLMIPACTYNFTMLQMVILLTLTSVLGVFLNTGLCLFVSSISNSSIVPMTIPTVLIILSMFTGVDNVFFAKLRFFLPMSMGNFWDVTMQLVFDVFGMKIMLYQAICVVALFVGTIFLVISYRNFKTHQVV